MRIVQSINSQLHSAPWLSHVIVTAIALLVISVPIGFRGLVVSNDTPMHLTLAHEVRANMASGNLLPSWTWENQGYGGLGTRLYPPLTPYSLALTSALTGDDAGAVLLYFVGWTIVGCVGIFLFVREWSDPLTGILASACFALAPYHLFDIFQYAFLAEYAATALLPFVLLFLTRICRRGEPTDVIPLSIFTSLLVLSHLPSTIMMLLALPVYACFVLDWRIALRATLLFSGSCVITALVTAFYWLRLASEFRWVSHYDERYMSGMFAYDKWLFPDFLLDGGSGISGFAMVSNFDRLSILSVLILIPPLVWTVLRRYRAPSEADPVIRASTATGVFAFFMVTVASSPVWSSLTLLQRIQFPWRWLSVVSVAAVAAFALTLRVLSEREGRISRVIAISSISLLLLVALYDVRQNFVLTKTVTFAEFDTVMQTKAAPSSPAWWPIWAHERALDVSQKVIAGGRSVQIESWRNNSRRFSIAEGPATNARVATFYYPYWRARVNGSPAEVSNDENGALTLPIGSNAAYVQLEFHEPEIYRAGELASMLASLAVGLAAILVLRRRTKLNDDQS
jgi:hypothetical protein